MSVEPISDAELENIERSVDGTRTDWPPNWTDLRLVARIRALEAEIARKDAALRELERSGPSVHVTRIARAALGPWVPTHQHYKGGLYRELMCGIDAENGPRNGRAVVVYESQDGKCFVLPAVVFDENVYAYQLAPGGPSATEEHVRRYRPLTPDEARAAVKGRSNG